MLLHNHLDMIGRNEPIQRKAKFWQSYVRALKGTDDIRAPDAVHYSRYPSSRGIFRPFLDFPSWPNIKSIYDDPIHPSERISVPGYRYLPISRETYGLTPRNIYPHHFTSIDRIPRLADHDYESRVRGEFVHDEHGHFQFKYYVPWSDWDPVEGRQMDQKHLNPAYRRLGTRPFVKEYTIGPDGAKVPLYTYTGTPIYSRGGITKRPMVDLFEPKNWIPLSRYTRDPWWWQYPQYKPFEAPYVPMKHSPFYLRDSYLSPVKNTYLWRDHPIRPFSTLIKRTSSLDLVPSYKGYLRDPYWWLNYRTYYDPYISASYLYDTYLPPIRRTYSIRPLSSLIRRSRVLDLLEPNYWYTPYKGYLKEPWWWLNNKLYDEPYLPSRYYSYLYDNYLPLLKKIYSIRPITTTTKLSKLIYYL